MISVELVDISQKGSPMDNERHAIEGDESSLVGRFVTAKLRGLDDCRQGVVVSVDPLRIRGVAGDIYDCEGVPTIVDTEMISAERLKKGLYWQRAWKLVEGCTKVSAGCDHCWSEAETRMRAGHPNHKIADRACAVLGGLGLTEFDGEILLREDNLLLPELTKKPTVFAVWNDLFHENVPDEFIDRAYALMALCPQHVFLVLTKRAERMAEYWSVGNEEILDRLCSHSDEVEDVLFNGGVFPPRQIWQGVTVENQDMADQRIPYLLQIPGKRFVSIEPMLGLVDLRGSEKTISPGLQEGHDWLTGDKWSGSSIFGGGPGWMPGDPYGEERIHAVILGGESGKNARPMRREWVRSVRNQCREAEIPFFFKQWGEYAPNWLIDDDGREISGSMWVDRMGRRSAGRTLDGQLHDDLAWVE